jgi:cadmium resistance protein CadD (predicted permease)
MKLNLKKIRYDSRFEGLLLILGGGIFCCVLLYGVLTRTLDKNAWFVIGGFALFASALLLGLWKLIKGKSTDIVNLNGWKYKLFKKTTKSKFILIVGAINALCTTVICLLALFVFRFLPLNSNDIFVLLIVFFCCVIFISLISGYITYQKYTGITAEPEEK